MRIGGPAQLPRALGALALVALAAGPLSGCGGAAAAQTAPSVYAASSLRDALEAVDPAPHYNFAGSNTLQLQIERGAPADVFASASPKEAQALFRANRCTRPVTFATNVLVMIVPKADRARLGSVSSLRRSDLRLAVGTAGVPIGDYTRQVLRRLRLSSVLSTNTVSQEKDVASITAKVALGSADAGFVYHTDALASRDRTREIPLPAWAQPAVRYQICAVRRDGADTRDAEAFIAKVRAAAGRAALSRFGFGMPARG
jgi:molybdate transport system substrate-binding protein